MYLAVATLPKRGLRAFSYAAVKSDMPALMANIESDALALAHVAALASAVGMLLDKYQSLGKVVQSFWQLLTHASPRCVARHTMLKVESDYGETVKL